jgi:predicted DNA-binding transcriptional regulator AlpA
MLPAASETGKGQQPPRDDVGILGESSATPRFAAELEPLATGPLQADSLISIREIRALFGLGRTAAYELTHRPDFPAPVRILPRCYRWWAAEVAAFTADLRRQAQPSNRQRAARGAAPAQDMPALHITGKVRMARRRK